MKEVDRALELVEQGKAIMLLPAAQRVPAMVPAFPDLVTCLRRLAVRDKRLIELREQLKLAVSELRKALWATQDPKDPGFKGSGRLATAQRNLDLLLIEIETVISQKEV